MAGTNFYSVRDVFSWNKGRHTFKFGGELSLDKDIQQTLLNNYGVFSFTGTKAKSSNALADFLTRPAGHHEPGCADYRHWITSAPARSSRRTIAKFHAADAEPGLALGCATGAHRSADREATFKLGVQSKVLNGSHGPHRSAGGRAIRASAAASSPRRWNAFLAALRLGMGSVR